jgi:hypothetical protein
MKTDVIEEYLEENVVMPSSHIFNETVPSPSHNRRAKKDVERK